MYKKNDVIKMSYSKMNTHKSCGWRYKLQYVDKHFIDGESLASDFGVLIHHNEEVIASLLQEGIVPDYESLINDLYTVNIPKKDKYDHNGGIFGINILKDKYKTEFYEKDDRGVSYATKFQTYIDHGIYRIENFLKSHPDIVIKGQEQYFSISVDNAIFSGYIDRIYYDTKKDIYYIDDIKTKDKPFSESDLETPLQFVIYTLAAMSIYNVKKDKIVCTYDLPLLDLRQVGGKNDYVTNGKVIISEILRDIQEGKFIPNPSPLCYWCPFSYNNPKQPEEGKHLCPYYSLWTPTNKTKAVKNAWQGMENHEKIMEEFEKIQIDFVDFDLDF